MKVSLDLQALPQCSGWTVCTAWRTPPAHVTVPVQAATIATALAATTTTMASSSVSVREHTLQPVARVVVQRVCCVGVAFQTSSLVRPASSGGADGYRFDRGDGMIH